MGFPGSSDGKESACNVGDLRSMPGLGRPPGEGNGNPLQYSYLPRVQKGGGRGVGLKAGINLGVGTQFRPTQMLK